MEEPKPIECVVFVEDKGGDPSGLSYNCKQIAAIRYPPAIPRVGEFIYVNMPESPAGHQWEVTRVWWHMENPIGKEIDKCRYMTVYVGVKHVPLRRKGSDAESLMQQTFDTSSIRQPMKPGFPRVHQGEALQDLV